MIKNFDADTQKIKAASFESPQLVQVKPPNGKERRVP